MISIGIVHKNDYEEIKNFLMNKGNNSCTKENSLIMAAKERGELLAVGIANIQSNYAIIEDIISDNQGLQLEYAMGKALLNAIDLRGIVNVFCTNNRLKDLLIRLRFAEKVQEEEVPDLLKQNSTIFYLNLSNYFTNHSCK